MLRVSIRILTMVLMLVIAIVIPSFDTIMSLMGSVLCFSICIIFPLAFYLKIFNEEISKREKTLDWLLIVVSAVMAVLGTIWVMLPKHLSGSF